MIVVLSTFRNKHANAIQFQNLNIKSNDDSRKLENFMKY